MGPGTYNVEDSAIASVDEGYNRGLLSMKEPRFRDSHAVKH